MELRKLLKTSSLSKKVGSSLTIISVCFRVIKKRYSIEEVNGYIKHNVLFLTDVPREIGIALYKDKIDVLQEINQELKDSDLKYVLKNIISK